MLHSIRLVIFGFALLCLSACDSNTQQEIRIQGDTITTPLPENIREIARLGNVDLAVRITINNTFTRQQRVLNDVSGDVEFLANVPADQSNNIKVEWLAFPNNTEVLMAEYITDTQPNQETLRVSLYNETGERFDFDGDGLTNLQEIRENRNALGVYDLEVPRQTTFLGPQEELIPGSIDTDTSGTPIEADANTTFSLRHDSTNLILYVCGQDEVLVGDTPTSSEPYWHDDTIFLYLDGADSDAENYDGMDDFQFAFVRQTEQMIISKGGNNQFCSGIDCGVTYQFNPAPGNTQCEYVLRVSLPIADLNMTIGEPVGFDLEINDDDDGGLREGSSGFVGFDDRSDLDPSSFAKIRLQP